jgi:hypothetical protein
MNKLRTELNDIISLILQDEELGRKKFDEWTMEGGELDKEIQGDWHWISHFFADTTERNKDKELDQYFKGVLQRILDK